MTKPPATLLPLLAVTVLLPTLSLQWPAYYTAPTCDEALATYRHSSRLVNPLAALLAHSSAFQRGEQWVFRIFACGGNS